MLTTTMTDLSIFQGGPNKKSTFQHPCHVTKNKDPPGYMTKESGATHCCHLALTGKQNPTRKRGRKKKYNMILTNFLVLSCDQQWKNETKQVKCCFHVLILIIQSSYCDVVGHQMNQSTSVRNS